jgi:hypothetical protein
LEIEAQGRHEESVSVFLWPQQPWGKKTGEGGGNAIVFHIFLQYGFHFAHLEPRSTLVEGAELSRASSLLPFLRVDQLQQQQQQQQACDTKWRR